METEELKPQKTLFEESSNKVACPECGNDFQPSRKDQKYCSGRCRSEATLKRKYGNSGNGASPKPTQENIASSFPSGMLNGINPQSQYMVTHLEKEVKRWETKCNEERAERKELKKKNEELREKIREMETDSKIKAIETKSPGLGGLLNNFTLGDLLNNPYIGPVIGAMAGKFMGGGAIPMGGVEVPAGNEKLQELINWFSSLVPETQESVYILFTALASQEQDQLPFILSRLINLLGHGTTANAAA